DRNVTGVQTCALPISPFHSGPPRLVEPSVPAEPSEQQAAQTVVITEPDGPLHFRQVAELKRGGKLSRKPLGDFPDPVRRLQRVRSEERRVGKECGSRW